MKANELRIGNWVFNGQNIQVTPKQIEWFSEGVYDLLPIELTEEWLLKFGFSKWKNKNNFSKGSFIVYTLSKKGFHYGRKSLRVELKYVHQLQNLYFALTGEELKIKNNE